jgi:hypothetical protein
MEDDPRYHRSEGLAPNKSDSIIRAVFMSTGGFPSRANFKRNSVSFGDQHRVGPFTLHNLSDPETDAMKEKTCAEASPLHCSAPQAAKFSKAPTRQRAFFSGRSWW